MPTIETSDGLVIPWKPQYNYMDALELTSPGAGERTLESRGAWIDETFSLQGEGDVLTVFCIWCEDGVFIGPDSTEPCVACRGRGTRPCAFIGVDFPA